jgi:hypothetical protein
MRKLVTSCVLLTVVAPVVVIPILSASTWAKTNSEVSVEIISSNNAPETSNRYQPSTLQCNNGGCTGAAGHSYAVVQDEVHATAIINGDKVLLSCGERRRKSCYVLPPGTYTGELKVKSVWITSTLPDTHESVRRRFDIIGGW